MESNELLAGIKTHVEELFRSLIKPYLVYHNLSHTQQVVAHATEIAAHMDLDEDSRFILLAAAWFHDTGHLLGDARQHEELSVWAMRGYFVDREIPTHILNSIGQTIMATRMPVHPVTTVEQILCDADTYHLGTSEFSTMDALVWKEVTLRTGLSVTNTPAHSLAFLKAHTFYTDYCRQLLESGKQQNIEWLTQSLSKQ
jgi:predicted metal-dependent HD superfamily phosphohydrolase